jgi:hypothetical protein
LISPSLAKLNAQAVSARFHRYSPNQRARRLDPNFTLSARNATDGS